MAKKPPSKQERIDLIKQNIKLLKNSLFTTDLYIVGIDPGRTSPGLCFKCISDKKDKDIFCKSIKTTTNGFNKVIEVEKWIDKHLRGLHNMVVMLEGPAMEAKFNREVMGETQGIIKRLIWEYEVPLFIAVPSQLKAFIGTKGKDQIIKEVYKKWNIDCETSDQADAAVLMKILECMCDIAMTISNAGFDDSMLNKLESKPHSFIDWTEKEAQTAKKILISKGEKAHEFSEAKKTYENTKEKETQK